MRSAATGKTADVNVQLQDRLFDLLGQWCHIKRDTDRHGAGRLANQDHCSVRPARAQSDNLVRKL